jgi:hypothetical protein
MTKGHALNSAAFIEAFASENLPQRFGLYEDLTVDENIRF